MPNRRRLIRLALPALLVAFLGLRYGRSLHLGGAPGTTPGEFLFSGTIQVDEVQLGSEYGGRVAEVAAVEGDVVRQGQVLVRLDTTLIDDQVAVAEAQLAVAEAGLARLQAGARPGAVAVAEAQRDQALAARDAARQALADAQALREEPQDLALQVAVMRAQVAAAEARVQQAGALRDAAEMGVDEQGNPLELSYHWGPAFVPSLELALEPAPYVYWQSWAGVNGAVAARDGLRDRLTELEKQLAAPQALIAQVHGAESALAQAEAGVAAAEAQVAGLRAGSTAEELAAAQARVGQAAAAVKALQLQQQRMALSSPLDGTVLVRLAEPGEVAARGAPLITLGSLQEVTLVLYVPEDGLGRVRLGQAVHAQVDSYPGRTFAGRVARIADQAEFTPRNVATQEERVNTYYAVTVRLPNPDSALKPGMPADATFVEE